MNQLKASDITFSNVKPVRLHPPKSTSGELGGTAITNKGALIIGFVVLGVTATICGTVATIILVGGTTNASPPPPSSISLPPPGFTFIRYPPPPPLPDPRHATQCIHHIGDSITRYVLGYKTIVCYPVLTPFMWTGTFGRGLAMPHPIANVGGAATLRKH